MNGWAVAGGAAVLAVGAVAVAEVAPWSSESAPIDESYQITCQRSGESLSCQGVVIPTSTSTSTSTTEVPTSTSTSTTTTSTTTTSSTSTSTSTTTTIPPTTTTTVPPASLIPPLSSVGPRGALTVNSATNLAPGNYSGQKFGGVTLASCGTYTFTDVEMWFNGALYPCHTVTLDHVFVNGGMWFENQGAVGGQTGWTIKWSKLNGGQMQAIRPKGGGSIAVSDSWLLVAGTPIGTGIHTEALQHLSGAQGTYDRVGFSVEPRWNGSDTPITAIATMEAVGDGASTVFTDCTFGYWNGTGWVAGGGSYAVYPGQATFVRPTIYHGGGSYWYNNVPPTGAKLVGPVYL